MSAYAKLMSARIELQSQNLKKSGHNKFANYSYFELGDFLPVIQTIFHKNKMAGVVSFGAELATLTIVDLEDNTQVVISSPMSSAALKGCHEVQNLGAVQTYIRRYLWVAALEIVEHDAIDSAPPKEAPSKPSRAIRTQAEVENLVNAATTPELLTTVWKALLPEEREMVRDLAAKHGEKLKNDALMSNLGFPDIKKGAKNA
jgi:hypothetical protein